MNIIGLNKTTLLDYPEHLAATVFTAGCNFRCPFCHNRDLVVQPDLQECISEEEIFRFLKKRQGIVQGICITGGEPTLQPDLCTFIRKIKQFGYLVKLDTNGYRPGTLETLLKEQLLDYIAMDIKAPLEKYGQVTGCPGLDTDRIRTSISLIQNSGISYEFRTTVVKELHERKDFQALADLLIGSKAYFLQAYRDNENVIRRGFHAYSKEDMLEFTEMIREKIPNTSVRGID